MAMQDPWGKHRFKKGGSGNLRLAVFCGSIRPLEVHDWEHSPFETVYLCEHIPCELSLLPSQSLLGWFLENSALSGMSSESHR